MKSRAAVSEEVGARLRPVLPWTGVVGGVGLFAAGWLGLILGATAHEDVHGDISSLAGAGIFFGMFGIVGGAVLAAASVGAVRRQRRRR